MSHSATGSPTEESRRNLPVATISSSPLAVPQAYEMASEGVPFIDLEHPGPAKGVVRNVSTGLPAMDNFPSGKNSPVKQKAAPVGPVGSPKAKPSGSVNAGPLLPKPASKQTTIPFNKVVDATKKAEQQHRDLEKLKQDAKKEQKNKEKHKKMRSEREEREKEIAELTRDVNKLLDREADSIRREKARFGNLSEDLGLFNSIALPVPPEYEHPAAGTITGVIIKSVMSVVEFVAVWEAELDLNPLDLDDVIASLLDTDPDGLTVELVQHLFQCLMNNCDPVMTASGEDVNSLPLDTGTVTEVMRLFFHGVTPPKEKTSKNQPKPLPKYSSFPRLYPSILKKMDTMHFCELEAPEKLNVVLFLMDELLETGPFANRLKTSADHLKNIDVDRANEKKKLRAEFLLAQAAEREAKAALDALDASSVAEIKVQRKIIEEKAALQVAAAASEADADAAFDRRTREATLAMRLEPLGQDRNYFFYWRFPSLPGLFVEQPVYGIDDGAALGARWGRFETLEQLQALVLALNTHGLREKPLRDALHGKIEGIAKDVSDDSKKRERSMKARKARPAKETATIENPVREQIVQRLQQFEGKLLEGVVYLEETHNSEAWNSSFDGSTVEGAARALVALSTKVKVKYLRAPFGEAAKKKKGTAKVTEDGRVETNHFSAWREECLRAESFSTVILSMCLLDDHVAWEKSVKYSKCQACKKKGDEAKLILCDSCDNGFHTDCLRPKLSAVPEGNWFCPQCAPPPATKKGRKEEKMNDSDDFIAPDDEVEEARSVNDSHADHCDKCHAGGQLMLCDECPRAFHYDCVGLKRIPRGAWSCDRCVRSRKPARPPPRNRQQADESSASYDDGDAEYIDDSGDDDSVEEEAEDTCAKCGKHGTLILCDNCPQAYHKDCVNLRSIPKGDWSCPSCEAKKSKKRAHGSDADEPPAKRSNSATAGSCTVCSSSENAKDLLKCEKCHDVCHVACTGLAKKPRGTWVCLSCIDRAQRKHFGRERAAKSRGRKNMKEIDSDEIEDDGDDDGEEEEDRPRPKRVKRGTEHLNVPATASTSRSRGSRNTEIEACEKVFHEIRLHNDAWPFLHAVKRREVPDYYDIVKSPMDFETMGDKFKSLAYQSKEEFIADVNLIINNCLEYNGAKSEYGVCALGLRKEFEKQLIDEGLSD